MQTYRSSLSENCTSHKFSFEVTNCGSLFCSDCNLVYIVMLYTIVKPWISIVGSHPSWTKFVYDNFIDSYILSSLKLKAVRPAVYSYLGDPKAACLVFCVLYRKPCSVLGITHMLLEFPCILLFCSRDDTKKTSVFSILQFLVSNSTRTLRRQCFVIGFKSVWKKRQL